MMLKQVKKSKIVMLLSLTILLSIGCTNEDLSSGNNQNSNEPQIVIGAIVDEWNLEHVSGNTSNQASFSFGVSLWNFEFSPTGDYYAVHEIQATEQTPLNMKLVNLSSEGFYYVLKLFVNYEETAFRILGEDEGYITEYIFFLEGAHEINLPFVLDFDFPESDSTYKLTASIFIDPNRYVTNEEHREEIYRWRQGMSLNADLVLGTGGAIELINAPSYAELIERQEDNGFFNFKVAQSFNFNDFGFLEFPDFTTQVQVGEAFSLDFYATPEVAPGYELENYIIIGLLNWQQVPLNGEPYLLVDATSQSFNNLMDHGTFMIDAINEPGFYDFIAILIPNPTFPNSSSNYRPLMLSNRLTIEVVE